MFFNTGLRQIAPASGEWPHETQYTTEKERNQLRFPTFQYPDRGIPQKTHLKGNLSVNFSGVTNENLSNPDKVGEIAMTSFLVLAQTTVERHPHSQV